LIFRGHESHGCSAKEKQMNTNTTQQDEQQDEQQSAGPRENLRRPGKRDQDPEALVAQGGVDPDVAARLKAERVQEMLRAMPEWQVTLEGKAINRVKAFPTPAVAALYGGYVIGLAGALDLPVTVSVAGGQVLVTLNEHRECGHLVELTEMVVGFAQQIG
jgi:hypothetical protein